MDWTVDPISIHLFRASGLSHH